MFYFHRSNRFLLSLLTSTILTFSLTSCSQKNDAETQALRQELDAIKADLARTEANKKLVLDMWNTVFTEKKVGEGFDRYISPDYVQHNPLASDGPESAREFLTQWFANNPDAVIEVKKVVAQGDLVFLHHHMRVNPTERGSAAVDMFRVADGKVIEHWDVVQPIPENSKNPHPMF